MILRWLAGLAVVGVTASFTGGPAHAGMVEDAEVFVRRGIDLRKEFKDREALEEFQRAYQIARTPRIEAQMGVAEQALGRWADAESHVSAALSVPMDGWIVKNRAALEKSLAAIRSHLGTLEIIGSPAAAKVRIDGRAVGSLLSGSVRRVPAGQVVVELSAPGYLPVGRTVSITAEELTRETITLQRAALSQGAAEAAATTSTVLDDARASSSPSPPMFPIAGTPTESVSSEGNRTWQRPLAWTLGGGALLFTGGGVAALLVRNGKADDYNTALDAGRCAGSGAEGCRQLHADGDRAQTLAIAAFGVAGAMAVASAILFATAPDPVPRAVAKGRSVNCGVDVQARGLICAGAL